MTEVVNKENVITENIQEKNGLNDTNKVKYDNLEIEKNSLNYSSKDKLPLIENKTHQLNNTLNNNRENIFAGSAEVQKKIKNIYRDTHTFCPPITNYKIRNNLKGVYDVYLRQDNHPDYGNFPYFDDYVEFEPEKYKRPDIFFGYVHDQYIVPHYVGLGNNNKKKGKDDDTEKNDEKENEDMKNKSLKTKNKKKVNKSSKASNIKSLDEIMNKYNLKYIEPPPKEKKVEPPPEEVPPEEEEDNKDKNKGKNAKDSANKGKNAKDAKDAKDAKNSKTSKK